MQITLLQKLINELNCPACSSQMSPPILRGRTGRNFCKNCFEQYNTCRHCQRALGIRNHSFEKLCFDVIIDCSFAVFGCRFAGSAIEVSAHEKICDFSTASCPLIRTTKCEWLGPKHDVEPHCEMNHPAHCTKGSHIRVNTNFSFGLYLGVIFCHDTIFRFTLYFCSESSRGYFTIVYLGHPHIDREFTYVVKFLKKDEVTVAKSFKKTCSHVSERPKLFGGESDFSVPISVMKEAYTDTEKLMFIISITKKKKMNDSAAPKGEPCIVKDSSPKSIENAILAELQCPVCYTCMKPPIVGCTNGHHFCNDCFRKVAHCPVCRGSKSCFTNLVMEDLYHLVNVPGKST